MMDNSNFKDTSIGPIPNDWDIGSLGNYLVLIRNGLTKRQNREGVGHPVTRIETIADDVINPNKVGFVEQVSQGEMEKFRLYPGDILFSHINSEPQLGRSVVYDCKPKYLLHGMNLLCLRTSDELDFHFLNYLFAHYRKRGIFKGIAARAVNQSSINQGKMKALEIPIPPLPEQRAIAHVLTTVRQSIEATEKVIDAAKELKRSLMKYLFTYGPVPIDQVDQVKLKETEIGEVPDNWDVCKLEKVTREIRQRNLELTYKRKDVLTVSNVDGFLTSERLLGNDLSKYKVVNQRNFGYNPMRLNVGSIAFRKNIQPGIVSPDYIVFEAIDDKILPEFINQYRYTDLWWKQIQMSGQGSIRIRYYYKHIKEFYIPVPPLHDQEVISSYLDTVETKIQKEVKLKLSLEEFFISLLYHLTTGKIRVGQIHNESYS